MSAIETLLERNSHARLVEPGPEPEALNTILRAALRAPDHGRLRPWRYVVIQGERREALGQCFVQSLAMRGITDPAQLKKAASAPLRALELQQADCEVPLLAAQKRFSLKLQNCHHKF